MPLNPPETAGRIRPVVLVVDDDPGLRESFRLILDDHCDVLDVADGTGLPQETCVVMVSGLEDVETARRTLTLGAADYIAKPVDFAYLDSVLEAHMLMAHLDASR